MDWRRQLASDFESFRDGLPRPLEQYVLDTYRLSLASSYAGIPIRNPFGKASGQLSLNVKQVETDRDAQLGFVVLKTVIAQNAAGAQSMKAWAIPATHMKIERIQGTREAVAGEEGWTVTWKGRGWSETFEDYLDFFSEALTVGQSTLVVPSVKYHLPQPGETLWRTDEYDYTTRQLYERWAKHSDAVMPLEKDFSPTLAGDKSFSEQKTKILEWLTEVPRLIALVSESLGGKIALGLKVFNAMFEDDFQLTLLRTCLTSTVRASYLIYGNRLFDPSREFEGVNGVAFGGPDLSDRNLSVLKAMQRVTISEGLSPLPLSATGNITTGRTAFKYLQRGATSFQMHTLFQLPDSEFWMKRGASRTERALHRLLFHPEHGFIAAALEAKERLGLPDGISIVSMSRELSTFL